MCTHRETSSDMGLNQPHRILVLPKTSKRPFASTTREWSVISQPGLARQKTHMRRVSSGAIFFLLVACLLLLSKASQCGVGAELYQLTCDSVPQLLNVVSSIRHNRILPSGGDCWLFHLSDKRRATNFHIDHIEWSSWQCAYRIEKVKYMFD
ncbi:hypothetical protein DFH29DRAFT_635893 [Suillus ampliporus]|nr:hypothetical protein DFH29DRAFT_635893 [Suillus ampliporus]